MDKILHDPKDPKLWELWYIPYYGYCRILSINRSISGSGSDIRALIRARPKLANYGHAGETSAAPC